MASPKIPFNNYRILDLAPSVTYESLLKLLNLEHIAHKILVSVSHPIGIESLAQIVTLTIPEGYDPDESSVSIEGRLYLLDKDFEVFTPLCSTPTIEPLIEYAFSPIVRANDDHAVSSLSQA